MISCIFSWYARNAYGKRELSCFRHCYRLSKHEMSSSSSLLRVYMRGMHEMPMAKWCFRVFVIVSSYQNTKRLRIWINVTKKSARCLYELFLQTLVPRICSRDILADQYLVRIKFQPLRTSSYPFGLEVCLLRRTCRKSPEVSCQ